MTDDGKRLEIEGSQAGLSRAELIARAAVSAATLTGLNLIGARKALALVGDGDVDTLNFILPFEHLQEEIYEKALTGQTTHGKKHLLSADQRRLVTALLGQEREHIDSLTRLIRSLGGRPLPRVRGYFAYADADTLFRYASYLEESAINAYNTSIPLLESGKARALAGSIAQVEGRHVAAWRLQMGDEPAPDAFDELHTPYEVLSSVQKFTGPAIFKYA